MTVPKMTREQAARFSVDVGNNGLPQSVGDDLRDDVSRPAAAQRAHLITNSLHPVVASTGQAEAELGNGAAANLASGNQPVPVKRRCERQRARPGDDRFVQVKESGRSSAAALDGCTHGPAA